MKTRPQHLDRTNPANPANAAQRLDVTGVMAAEGSATACEPCEPRSPHGKSPTRRPQPRAALNLENTVNDVTTEFLQCPPENEAMRRTQQWFAEGRRLSWLPIFSQANFPGVPIDILQWADRALFQSAWPISRLEDFMRLPPGITGWLLPEGDDDTDTVVAVWEGMAHFLSVRDRRTGEPQTLMSARKREMEGQVALPAKDVGDYPQ